MPDDDLVLAHDGRSGTGVWKTNVNFNTFGRCAFTTCACVIASLQGILRPDARRLHPRPV
jgi:hypothetical protein